MTSQDDFHERPSTRGLVDSERGSGEKRRVSEQTLAKIDHSATNACVEKAATLSLENLLAPAGSMSRARSLNVCLTGSEKLSKTVGLDLVRALHVDFLQHDRLHLRRVSAAPQFRRGHRGLFTKRASVDVWAFALRLLLRCQLPVGRQPNSSRNNRSKKCLFVSQAGASPLRASRTLPFGTI